MRPCAPASLRAASRAARGEAGTIVETLDTGVFEVEFCDDEGQTYAMLALRADQLILLHNQGKPLTIAA